MQYCGRIKSYNPKQGYGFLDCQQAHDAFGRDVFIHKAQMGELLGRFVGPGTKLDPKTLKMNVCFSVEINKSGMPQARDVGRLEDMQEGTVNVEQEHEKAEPNPVLPNFLDIQSSEPLDEDAARGGYQGRGGTIRIPSTVEGAEESSLSPTSNPLPQLTPVHRGSLSGSGNGGGTRKSGRCGGAAKWSPGSTGNVYNDGMTSGECFSAEPQSQEGWDYVKDDQRKGNKQGSLKKPGPTATVSSPADSKKGAYKDQYFQQLPQQPYGLDPCVAGAFFQANGQALQYGQVHTTQQQSQPVTSMAAPAFAAGSTVSAVYGVPDPQSPSGVSFASFQMPASALSFPTHMSHVCGSAVASYGDLSNLPQLMSFQQQGQQIYGQLQPLHHAVPMSPQSSSQYAPSTSSPPMTPLQLHLGSVTAVSDATSSSPMSMHAGPQQPGSFGSITAVSDGTCSSPMSMHAGPPLPGMLLPMNAGHPQDMAMLLPMSGVDPTGSPVIHPGSFQASRLDDSDSDTGYSACRLPMLPEALPPGMCSAGATMTPYPMELGTTN